MANSSASYVVGFPLHLLSLRQKCVFSTDHVQVYNHMTIQRGRDDKLGGAHIGNTLDVQDITTPTLDKMPDFLDGSITPTREKTWRYGHTQGTP